MGKYIKYSGWIVAILGGIVSFVFFQCYYPYHLFHREQISLFLYSEEYFWELLGQSGGLAILGGEFLTQFFYFIGGGAIVLTFLIILLGVLCYQSLCQRIGNVLALLFTLLICLWEAGRECLVNYPLASTLSLIGGFTLYFFYPLIQRKYARFVWGVLLLLVGYGLIGYGIWVTALLLVIHEIKERYWTNVLMFLLLFPFLPYQPMKGVKLWGVPNFYLEHLLSLDTNAYFGKWEKVRELAQKDLRNEFGTYYFNLSNAQKQELPDHLMNHYQPFTRGLFLPVDPSGNYLSFMASSELWYQLGDMTMAEHSAILGMISTSHHRSSRMMKRMAEINLINDDEEAAMKYLRMLQKTWKYREWAEQRMPGQQHPNITKWINNKRKNLPSTDTLRLAGNTSLSLRHLLKSNPNNLLAYQYLLCHDLLSKDIYSFVKDFVPEKGITSRIYQEAMLIYFANQQVELTPQIFSKYGFTTDIMQDFHDYTRLYEENNEKRAELYAKYGKTYWFYFHFATKKQ